MIPKFRLVDKVKKEIWNVESISWDFGVEVDFLHVDAFKDAGDIKTFSRQFELLQSTGLKDKNGVEVFEGDIVKAVRKHSEPKLIEDRYCKGIITYSHGCYDIKVEPNVFSGLIPENLLTDIDLTIEVIGNIYQNPHLLEE